MNLLAAWHEGEGLRALGACVSRDGRFCVALCQMRHVAGLGRTAAIESRAVAPFESSSIPYGELRTTLFEPFEILRRSNSESIRKEKDNHASGRELGIWLPKTNTYPNTRLEKPGWPQFSTLLTGAEDEGSFSVGYPLRCTSSGSIRPCSQLGPSPILRSIPTIPFSRLIARGSSGKRIDKIVSNVYDALND